MWRHRQDRVARARVKAYEALIASPADLGNVAVTGTSSALTLPAGARLALSCSVALSGDEVSTATALTASTISFTAPSTIEDSGDGLGVFVPGDRIRVTGSASNNRLYTVVTASDGSLTVAERTVVAEDAGASVTITKVVFGDITVNVGGSTFGHPTLEADEVFRGHRGGRDMDVTVTRNAGSAGTLTLYIVDLDNTVLTVATATLT